jgi:predicted dinucleotide-binding enzyme
MDAMKVGVLGTGMVGQVIGSKLISLGHEVKMGSRTASNEKAVAWAKEAGERASFGTYAAAAEFGQLLFNCTSGRGTLPALNAAGSAQLRDKTLIDISNPLDFSRGMPPSLFTPTGDSLAEEIQRAFPTTRVVKALNTMTCTVMVDPGKLGAGDHEVFVCGNDVSAKAHVTTILRDWFGWQRITDFGDITGARALEAYVLFWVRAWGALGTAEFNVRFVR